MQRIKNILFVHYNDLKHNLVEKVQRVAVYLGIPVTDEEMPVILKALSLEAMRANEERVNGARYARWKDGTKTFFFKGTNGRWKDVLSAPTL